MLDFAELKALGASKFLEIKDNSSVFYQLLQDKNEHSKLLQLFADPAFLDELLKNDEFIPSVLRTIDTEKNKNIPAILLLSFTSTGDEVTKILFKNTHFVNEMTNSPNFITTLLKTIEIGEVKNLSMLFYLLLSPHGRTLLRSLFHQFGKKLIDDPGFIPALLSIIENGSLKNTSALYFLADTGIGFDILKYLFSDKDFKKRLLQDPATIRTLLKTITNGKRINQSTLFLLLIDDKSIQLLQEIVADEDFKKRLIEDPEFISDLLRIMNVLDNQHSSILLRLVGMQNGTQLLQQWLMDDRFITKLLQDPDFISTFLKLGTGREQNISVLYLLAGKEIGRQILQKLFSNEEFRARLLQDSALMAALLEKFRQGGNNYTALFWLSRTQNGRFALDQLLADKHFRTSLISDSRFTSAMVDIMIKPGPEFDPIYWFFNILGEYEIPEWLLNNGSFTERLLQAPDLPLKLLQRIETRDGKHIPALTLLAVGEHGRHFLNKVFADTHLRRELLGDPKFISMLLESVEGGGRVREGTSALFWITAYDYECPILEKLFLDKDFMMRLLEQPVFIPAVLKTIETERNKNASILFWLINTERSRRIFIEMLKNPSFTERLSQQVELIRTLFLQFKGKYTGFSNILGTLEGLEIFKTLMQSTQFRANFMHYLHLDVPSVNLSWLCQGMEGFNLLKRLYEEKQMDLLGTPLKDLLAHPQIQLYVRQGVLDPSLFLLISATDGGDAYFHYLENPACSPWVMTDRGYSLKDLIESSSLDESEKRKRITALESMIIKRQAQISMHDLVTSPGVLNTELSAAVQPMEPQLPPLTDAEFNIDGVAPSSIQEFQQYISWGSNQESLGGHYKAVFQELFNNTNIRNSHDFPIALSDLKKLCLWINGYLQAKVDIPAPEPYWAFDVGHLCEEAVQATFRQMFETLSKGSEIALYLEGVANSATAQYSRVLAIPINMEIHLRIVRVLAAMGVATSLPTRDPYLRNLSPRRIQSIAQSAMDTLIHQESLVHFLVDRLSFGVQEITYEELMKKYFYYRNSSLFDSEMTTTQFMAFVTGLTAVELGERDYTTHPNFPIRPDLNALLTEKAIAYAHRLPLYADRELQEQTQLLWQFLTAAPDQLLKEQRELADEFLSRCEQATDGIALIKHCIESHRDNIGDINVDAFFYKNPQGLSLFSLLISNPLFTEWLFDYKMTTTNIENIQSIQFTPNNSFMSRLRTALFSSEKIADALESALTQPGTLFFWLYYFQQDAQRAELFKEILGFILSSPKKLYTYDSLAPVIFDMLRSTSVSAEGKMLVQTFLESRFSEQVKSKDDHCWLTVSLMVNPQETILATLRANLWALRTLKNPEHMHTIGCLMKGREADLQEIQTLLLQDQQEAAMRYSLFGAATTGRDAAGTLPSPGPSFEP